MKKYASTKAKIHAVIKDSNTSNGKEKPIIKKSEEARGVAIYSGWVDRIKNHKKQWD